MTVFLKYLLRFGLLGTLTFLSLFVYFFKTNGNFRKSILVAFVATSLYFSDLSPAHSVGEADAFTPQNPQHITRPIDRSSLFGDKSSNDGSGPGKPGGSGPGKPDSSGSDGENNNIPKYPKRESVEETQHHLSNIDELIHKLEEETDSSDSEIDECRVRRIHPNSPRYSETITFCDGYKAKSVNSAVDHQLVKHGHDWQIDDMDLKSTEDANKRLGVGQFREIRTRLNPANRNQFRSNLREFASNPELEVYSYPINKGLGRAYLDPKTKLFVGIDENGIIRKTYMASEDLIEFLETKCDVANSGNE